MEKKITEEQKAKFRAELRKFIDFQNAIQGGMKIEEAAKKYGLKLGCPI